MKAPDLHQVRQLMRVVIDLAQKDPAKALKFADEYAAQICAHASPPVVPFEWRADVRRVLLRIRDPRIEMSAVDAAIDSVSELVLGLVVQQRPELLLLMLQRPSPAEAGTFDRMFQLAEQQMAATTATPRARIASEILAALLHCPPALTADLDKDGAEKPGGVEWELKQPLNRVDLAIMLADELLAKLARPKPAGDA